MSITKINRQDYHSDEMEYTAREIRRVTQGLPAKSRQEIYNRLHEGMDIYLMRDVFSEACKKAIEGN